MSEVLIYTGPRCGYCRRAKLLLDGKAVDYREIEIGGNPELRQQMIETCGRHTVPQVWVGETHVGGCDDLFALEYSGELDGLLAESGIAIQQAAS